MPDTKLPQNGATWYTSGAQKGVHQPPYAVRYRGRWYRTVAKSYITDDVQAQIDALGPIPFGIPALHAYLSRRNKHFRDLSLWPIGTTVDEHGKPPGFDDWLAEKRRVAAEGNLVANSIENTTSPTAEEDRITMTACSSRAGFGHWCDVHQSVRRLTANGPAAKCLVAEIP